METWAVIRELDIHGDERYHKQILVSDSYEQDRYTPTTIELIEKTVEDGEIDPQAALDKHWG